MYCVYKVFNMFIKPYACEMYTNVTPRAILLSTCTLPVMSRTCDFSTPSYTIDDGP